MDREDLVEILSEIKDYCNYIKVNSKGSNACVFQRVCGNCSNAWHHFKVDEANKIKFYGNKKQLAFLVERMLKYCRGSSCDNCIIHRSQLHTTRVSDWDPELMSYLLFKNYKLHIFFNLKKTLL